jgi:hypothetical protein
MRPLSDILLLMPDELSLSPYSKVFWLPYLLGYIMPCQPVSRSGGGAAR